MQDEAILEKRSNLARLRFPASSIIVLVASCLLSACDQQKELKQTVFDRWPELEALEANLQKPKPYLDREALLLDAKNGSSHAAALLGQEYTRGDLFAVNAKEAEKWLKVAVEGGDPLGYYFYAGHLMQAEGANGTGEQGRTGDDFYALALSAFEKKCRDGHDYDALGTIYRNGYGTVDPDVERATELCLKSCDFDFPRPWTRLGWFCEMGIGMPLDEQKAFRCYQKACDLGSGMGAYHLGRAYLQGIGTEENRELALAWLGRSALAGVPEAYFSLEQVLDFGHGEIMNQDFAKISKVVQTEVYRFEIGEEVKIEVTEDRFWIGAIVSQSGGRYHLRILSRSDGGDTFPPSSSTGQLALSDDHIGELRWIAEALVQATE